MTANEKKQMRKNKRNARIARGRFIKNLFIWLLGVLFLPMILVLSLVVIPIGTFTGNDKENPIVSEEIASMAILPALLKIGEFGVSDLPFLEDLLKGLEETQVSESGTIGDLIEIDYGKLNTLKFGSETFSSDLTSCITVTATIDSVGGAGLFGDANIEAFSTFSEVASEDKPEIVDGYIKKTEAGEFTSNPKLYNYNADELSGGGADPFTEDPEEDNANYERAFTDDGKLLIDESVTLYTVPLFKAPLLDAVDLIDEIFGRVEILELLTVFGVELPEEEGEEGIIQTLFEGKTVAELGAITVDDIYIYDILKGETDSQLYQILKQATGAETAEEITLGMLSSGLEINDVLISTFLTDTESDIFKILCDAVVVEGGELQPTAETLNIGHLSSFDTQGILLSSVMPKTDDNAKLYEVLLESLTITDELGATITNPTEDDITISHLSSFSTDGIKLNTVMPYDAEKNAKLYDIIEDVTGQGYSSVTLSHMKEFDTGKIHISTVLEKGDNAIINAIIENGGSIGDMDTAISSLTLYEVYKDVCFTTDENKAVDNSQKYVLSEVDGKAVYTRSESGTYFVSEDAGIWMIICFDGNATENENGRSTVYTENDMTLGDLLNSGNSLNSRIHGATIRELISVGIIKGVTFNNEAVYKMTFSEFLTAAADALNNIA